MLNFFIGRWFSLRKNLWIANVIAVIAFSAAHLPVAMMLLEVNSPAQLPTAALIEIFLLNGLVGLVAGERFILDGLVAAVGVHFWVDIVWHVIFPIF